MPGPLPQPTRRRRNAPTIPTTTLPATGRPGPAPRLPKSVELAAAGAAWWRWAWRTPQAAAWSTGDLYAVARRAQLEDDLAALRDVEGLDWDELGQVIDEWQQFKAVARSLASLVGGKLAIIREVRELEDRLGLTPKAMAQLRWTIKAETGVADKGSAGDDEVAQRRAERERRLAAEG